MKPTESLSEKVPLTRYSVPGCHGTGGQVISGLSQRRRRIVVVAGVSPPPPQTKKSVGTIGQLQICASLNDVQLASTGKNTSAKRENVKGRLRSTSTAKKVKKVKALLDGLKQWTQDSLEDVQ